MNEQNWFRRFRQYGYETDVFDKYRDAVARYNRSALRVLGMTGCLAGVLTLVFMLINGKTGGLFFAVLMLAAGIAGTVVARLKDSTRFQSWATCSSGTTVPTRSGSGSIWP